METVQLSKPRRLSNDEVGGLQRRVNEIARRVEEGTIDLSWVMEEMQRIIEGKKLLEMRYREVAEPLDFVRAPPDERRFSRARLHMRLPHMLQRLEFPQRTPEHVMAEMWETECIPNLSVNFGRTPLDTIAGSPKPTRRDIQVINSTLQWLGTPVGKEFLARFFRVSQIHLR